ncbi:MAG: hypothetical protein E6J74_22970 [Deltaproteobacteria bacterium]|nr:MAG: hypothetical protein E6J74_22970 [Deltaproteobacteria bacterium]
MKYRYKPFPLSHTDPVTKLDYAWRSGLTVFISHDGKRSAPLESIVDTGADHCVFDAEIADGLGIPVRKGQQVAFSGIAKGAETIGTCTWSRSLSLRKPMRRPLFLLMAVPPRGYLARSAFSIISL